MQITKEYLWQAFTHTGDINYYMLYKSDLQSGEEIPENENLKIQNNNENNNLIYS